MQANTLQLISRVTGAAGAKSNGFSALAKISGDGRFVAYRSAATNLSPDDSDTANDIFMRDLQTDATILVSRATGAAGVNGNLDSFTAAVSDDGRMVAFGSNATNLTAEIPSAGFQVFVRDTQADTTTFVSRASGAAGAPSNGLSTQSPGISDDGRIVSFNSQGTNLDPADTDTFYDVYVRDLQTATTSLMSRASGVSGAKGNGPSSAFLGPTAPSADGRYVAFHSEATNMSPDDADTTPDVFVRDRQDSVTSLESRGPQSYVRPKGATPISAPLVPAFEACTSPNRIHGPALAFGSCSAPVQTSDYLTVGTPDSNGRLLKGLGSMRYLVIVGNPGTPADEADVVLAVSMTDVRNQAGLGDYTGELRASVGLGVTDRINGPSQQEDGSMQPFDLAITVPCAATGDTTVGSTCQVNTTADAVVAGTVKEGKRAVWAMDQLRLYDGGSDGVASTTGDDTLFAVQGILVP
jgi:hypothetical protein